MLDLLLKPDEISLVVHDALQCAIKGIDSVCEIVDVLIGEEVDGGGMVAESIKDEAMVVEGICYIVVTHSVWGCVK